LPKLPRRPLSVFVLAYNSADKIRQCLESVSWADEIVVVDSFSADSTEAIAREFTDKVIQHEFKGFGELRNFALSRLSHEWVLSVDSDEVVTPEFRAEIEGMLERGPDADAYFVPRINYFLRKYKILHGGWYPDYRQPQFFNRNKFRYREDQLVHEGFVCDGRVGYMKEHVIQYPFLTLREFLEKMDRYSNLMARQRIESGKRFSAVKLIFSPPVFFVKMYIFRRGFMDGLPGLVLALLYANYTLLKYVKLWNLERNGDAV